MCVYAPFTQTTCPPLLPTLVAFKKIVHVLDIILNTEKYIHGDNWKKFYKKLFL